MTTSPYKVRRATVDDRDCLVALWDSMRLPSAELEKRLTEFQVVVDADDRVLGAIGIQLTAKQGLIHSEGYTDFSQAEGWRASIWERLQSVANNHGLIRLWTCETAPFWSRCGLSPATAEELEKLPGEWRNDGANWLTLKLREDLEEVVNLDQEFSMFMEAEKQRSAQMMDQAKMLKLFATLLALAIFLAVVGVAIWMVTKNPGLLGR